MFLLPRKEKNSFENEAGFAKKARLMGNYSVLKTSILRAHWNNSQKADGGVFVWSV